MLTEVSRLPIQAERVVDLIGLRGGNRHGPVWHQFKSGAQQEKVLKPLKEFI